MATDRKFFRTVIQIEVLSEDEPYDLDSKELVDIAVDVTDGQFNGKIETLVENQEISPQLAAVLLIESGSDPGFFNLTEEGGDAE